MTTPEIHTFTVETTGDGLSSVASGRLPNPVQTFTIDPASAFGAANAGAAIPVSMTATNAAETLAQRFHEAYERLAPSFGYETREASAKPWAEVPENNRALMIAVCQEILGNPASQTAPSYRAFLGESPCGDLSCECQPKPAIDPEMLREMASRLLTAANEAEASR